MSAKEKTITSLLKSLETNSDVDSCALVSERGQLMAAALHTDIDQKAISAMAAALVSIGKRVGSALGSGEPRGVQIDGVDKLIVVRSLKGASLIASAPSDAKIGLIDFEIEKVIGEIESVL